VTLDVSRTVLEILPLIARKILVLPTPSWFDSLGVTPFEFCDEIWHQKTGIVALLDGEEIMTLAFFVLAQYRRVTDGRTDTLRSLRPALA